MGGRGVSTLSCDTDVRSSNSMKRWEDEERRKWMKGGGVCMFW